jgi:hypothetical protein
MGRRPASHPAEAIPIVKGIGETMAGVIQGKHMGQRERDVNVTRGKLQAGSVLSGRSRHTMVYESLESVY